MNNSNSTASKWESCYVVFFVIGNFPLTNSKDFLKCFGKLNIFIKEISCSIASKQHDPF